MLHYRRAKTIVDNYGGAGGEGHNFFFSPRRLSRAQDRRAAHEGEGRGSKNCMAERSWSRSIRVAPDAPWAAFRNGKSLDDDIAVMCVFTEE